MFLICGSWLHLGDNAGLTDEFTQRASRGAGVGVGADTETTACPPIERVAILNRCVSGACLSHFEVSFRRGPLLLLSTSQAVHDRSTFHPQATSLHCFPRKSPCCGICHQSGSQSPNRRKQSVGEPSTWLTCEVPLRLGFGNALGGCGVADGRHHRPRFQSPITWRSV